jgi:hypothetical protein
MVFSAVLGILASFCTARQPKDKAPAPPKSPPPERPGGSSAVDGIVARMMAFDKNKDGKLTRDEITDTRLLRLFERADANQDGVVTKEELSTLAGRMVDEAASDERRGGFGPPGGPGGFGSPGAGGRGPGGFGPPPQPGQIMPPFLQDMLKLTAEQKKQLEELQKEVDGKLGKILTDEQKKQFKTMREGFGRGGRGPGGRGPGGPPPGGEGGRPRPPE